MEPAFLLDILCQIETVSQQCPKRCNSCPEIGKYHNSYVLSLTYIYSMRINLNSDTENWSFFRNYNDHYDNNNNDNDYAR